MKKIIIISLLLSSILAFAEDVFNNHVVYSEENNTLTKSEESLYNPFGINRSKENHAFNTPTYFSDEKSFRLKPINKENSEDAWNYINVPMKSRYTRPLNNNLPNDTDDAWSYKDASRLNSAIDRAKQVLNEMIIEQNVDEGQNIVNMYMQKINNVSRNEATASGEGSDPVNKKGYEGSGYDQSWTHPNWGADIFSVSYFSLQALQQASINEILTRAKEEGKQKVKELSNLSNEEKAGYNDKIDATKILEEVALIIEAAKNQNQEKNLIIGDLNGDGQVNALDLSLLKRYILTKEIPNSVLNEVEFLKVADINKDGKVNTLDLSLLKKIFMDRKKS